MINKNKLFLFLLVFLSLFVCISPASGDILSSGNITYSYGESLSYMGGGDVHTSCCDILVKSIAHYFTDYQVLNSIVFKNAWTRTQGYTKYDVVSFSATVDSIYYGDGYIYVVEQLDGTIWYTIDFSSVDSDYAETLVGFKDIVLTYDDSVWNGVSQRSSTDYYGGRAITDNYITSAQPTGMHYSSSGPTGMVWGHFTGDTSDNVLMSYSQYYDNSYIYTFNSTTNLSSITIDKFGSTSKWDIYDSVDFHYLTDDDFGVNDIYGMFPRQAGVYSNVTFDTAPDPTSVYTIIDINGTTTEPPDDEDEDEFEYNITTELDEYSLGDTVNVTYTTDQKGTIQVVKTISGVIYHSIGFVSGATNATWQFYIAGNEPYGFYDVYLLDSSNTILDSVRYSLLPTTSSLDILQSSVDLHETFVVFAQTVNESILSIEDPDGVEVWNESIGALMYDYIYYTPTIKTGIYTAYLYDDATLNDTVMVYLADPPIIDDPLDPETNGTIPIEDVLEDDESMTEYFDDKFREFAPTAWGIFLLSIILWLMAILTSFGGSGKRR